VRGWRRRGSIPITAAMARKPSGSSPRSISSSSAPARRAHEALHKSPGLGRRVCRAQAPARLQHERAFNSFIASRNPHLPSTERYQRGPLPPWHPRFGSPANYLNYLARREMGRFDPQIDYPTPERSRR
jgi:hypothetical protein